MQKLTKKSALLGAGSAFVLLGAVAGIAVAQSGTQSGAENDAEIGVPASTMVRAINAATGAKAGDVAKVEVEVEAGKTMIDVEILSKDGKTYEVGVEAASGKVASVKVDTEDETNEKDEKDGENDKD